LIYISKQGNDQGHSIIAVIVVMVVLSIFVSSALSLNSADTQMSSDFRLSAKAFSIGNAAIVYARRKLDNGENPVTNNKVFADGSFDIQTDPTQSLVMVTGDVNNAQKQHSLNVDFARNCTEYSEQLTNIQEIAWNDYVLNNLRIKKSCNSKSILDKLVITWNLHNQAKMITCGTMPCLATPANITALAGAQVQYGFAKISQVDFDGQTLFSASSSSELVAHDVEIPLTDTTISDTAYHDIDIHFHRWIASGMWIWVTGIYLDGSQLVFGPFKVEDTTP